MRGAAVVVDCTTLLAAPPFASLLALTVSLAFFFALTAAATPVPVLGDGAREVEVGRAAAFSIATPCFGTTSPSLATFTTADRGGEEAGASPGLIAAASLLAFTSAFEEEAGVLDVVAAAGWAAGGGNAVVRGGASSCGLLAATAAALFCPEVGNACADVDSEEGKGVPFEGAAGSRLLASALTSTLTSQHPPSLLFASPLLWPASARA
mmetsp:Transcript_32733/g.84541  ORF Transcript_32733/g.84541 Transcript_32733/m.84541 type:complete len:209 (-) Transcript_32733:887-1513(-)